MSMSDTPVSIDTLKSRLKAMWMDGNYDYFSRFMESSAVEFLDRIGVRPGSTFLDVACGSGQLGLIAARRGARVTGVDIATNLVAAARARAAAEGLDARFDEGDAESLAYLTVASTPSPAFTARCSPRGPNWSPSSCGACAARRHDRDGELDKDGFVGQMFKTVARHVPARTCLLRCCGGRAGRAGAVRTERGRPAIEARQLPVRLSVRARARGDLFRDCYGPTVRAFAALPADGQAALHGDLVDLWASYNRSTDPGRTIVRLGVPGGGGRRGVNTAGTLEAPAREPARCGEEHRAGPVRATALLEQHSPGWSGDDEPAAARSIQKWALTPPSSTAQTVSSMSGRSPMPGTPSCMSGSPMREPAACP